MTLLLAQTRPLQAELSVSGSGSLSRMGFWEDQCKHNQASLCPQVCMETSHVSTRVHICVSVCLSVSVPVPGPSRGSQVNSPQTTQDRGIFTRGKQRGLSRAHGGPDLAGSSSVSQLSAEKKQGCEPPASASTTQAPCPMTHHQNSSPIWGKGRAGAPGGWPES